VRRLAAFSIYANPHPLLVSRQALFPGIIELPDGRLLALLSIGQAFDAADMRSHVMFSTDEGLSWTPPVRLHDHEFSPPEQESYKPVLLADGRLLATGYAFVRPDPLQPIVDPVTLQLPRLVTRVSESRDLGRNWSVPRRIDIDGAPLELSGPATQLPGGRLIAATSPFHLERSGHAGWIVASDDGGESWVKASEFMRAPASDVHAWECRLAAWGEGRVAVLYWAYDNTREKNLNNAIAFSRDGGRSFGPPVDTGVLGQSSSLMHLEGETLLTIHTQREADARLVLRRVDVSGDGFRVLEELDLFADPAMGSTTVDMKRQFGNLKFGQPSVLRLRSGKLLAYCWSFEAHQYIIKGFHVAL
jgi:sialidase-1